MGGIFDDGIDAQEMGILLGITDEIEEEEAANKISNEPLTPEEMLKTGNDVFDIADEDDFEVLGRDELPDNNDEY